MSFDGIAVHGTFDDTNDDSDCSIVLRTIEKRKPYSYCRRNVSLRQKKVAAFKQRYKCLYCGHLLPPSYQVDHYIPLWQGGTNLQSNLVACCGNCHNEKTAIENDRVSPYFKKTKARAWIS